MRVLRTIFLLLPFCGLAWTADLKVRVLDPNSEAVAGAQITLYPAGTSTPVALRTSSSESMVTIDGLSDGHYQLQVLAPGFAPQSIDVSVPTETAVDGEACDCRRVGDRGGNSNPHSYAAGGFGSKHLDARERAVAGDATRGGF